MPSVADLRRCARRCGAKGAIRSRSTRFIPSDLVIDHSVQVDFFGTAEAFLRNVEREFERNEERYKFLSGRNRRSRTLASCRPERASFTRSTSSTWLRSYNSATKTDEPVAFPDTLVGTDSHTTMINGLASSAGASAASRRRP